ncbi:M43 family zinc metalloprotease [Pontibacter cellulosilyticus]|uniref:T9SS type A sorting domain-containing protein n=1 Tax=Pontibacter cellulosilyticus TaxID=1720253 RepID=A0A923N8C8_9BACT|nr:M43 family zinc metalloprotease [Pontibacter cellulosilyticus]MBC5994069.1 T9SS type A sorting domain-containing protein [Pontibacter cellulosilyticus]
MRVILASVLFTLYFAVPCLAQRACGTDTYVQALKQRYIGFEQQQQQAEQAVQQALQQKQQNGHYLRQAAVVIPVVFHVVHSSPAQNISDEQILSQLEILNADFRRKNKDAANTPSYFAPFATDTEIEFCLATTDPNGAPTTGITRTLTSRSSFSDVADDVKFTSRGGIDAWDRTQYLNIWVCSLSNYIIGYATPPGAPAAIDGVVLDFTTVGAPPFNRFNSPFNLGRTATHEVGHWLGLRHIWGGGATCQDSDNIADTPNQLAENVGCPSGMVSSCTDAPFGDMYQNYMDYTDDACMNLFTQGQGAYMRAVLGTSRDAITRSLACAYALRAEFTTAVANDTLIAAGSTVKFSDASVGVKPISYFWEFEGGVPATSTLQNPTVTYPQPGKYDVKLTIANDKLSNTQVKEAYIHTTVSDLVVYPNPASRFVVIEQPARVLVRQVELVNQLGQVIYVAEARDRLLRFDISSMPAGVYFLRITSTNGTVINKISVVK